MEILQRQYQRFLIDVPELDAVMLWDDDALFSPGAIRELRGHLKCLEHDRVEARSWFLHDSEKTYNDRFPEHWSACLFRVYEGDKFPTDFEVHCPRYCARSSNVARLTNPWLNYGYLTEADREFCWESQKAAGKIDGHTLCLTQPPQLVSVPPGYRYRRNC